MKRMGAVESDSVKSAMKAKDNLHKACERASELMSKPCMGRNKTIRMASMRESRDSDRFLVNTSTITYTAAPRVWHFSVFHCFITNHTLCVLRLIWNQELQQNL